jgi:hypothetical protein
MPDWLVRTIKTFVQAFIGTLIPALCVALGNAPQTWAEVLPWLGTIFTPVLILGDCLAAGICAVWNGLKELDKR